MELVTDNLGYDVWELEDIPSTSKSIWILGRSFDYDAIEEIRDLIETIFFFSYRKNFPKLSESCQYTSDRGFGCMIRCGQMLLGEALKRVHKGKDWLWSKDTRDSCYLSILNRFEDTPDAPLGIHRILATREASNPDKKFSDWFSPNEISQVLKKLTVADEKFTQLSVHVALDCQLAKDEVQYPASSFLPLLIIIPVRLGLGELNPIYIDGLKRCLELSSSVGFIGGKPNQALYFFGYVENESSCDILYLDPHTCQKSGSVGNKETQSEIEMDESYHSRNGRRMSFSSMDPSLCVAFFCQTQQELDKLFEQLETMSHQVKTPIFEVISSRSMPWKSPASSMTSSRDLEKDLNIICGDPQLNEEFEEVIKEEGDSEDEFEIIE